MNVLCSLLSAKGKVFTVNSGDTIVSQLPFRRTLLFDAAMLYLLHFWECGVASRSVKVGSLSIARLVGNYKQKTELSINSGGKRTESSMKLTDSHYLDLIYLCSICMMW